MKTYIGLLLLALAVAAPINKGADLYSRLDDICIGELKSVGVNHVIPRCYNNIGHIDPKCDENIEAALDAGMTADVYIYPCPDCGDPAKQVADTIEAVGSRTVGHYWVFVDLVRWKDKEYNREFITQMTEELKRKEKAPGIYTNEFIWGQVVGLDWHEMAKYPLWYKKLDGSDKCAPFKAFAGWKAPFMKQYSSSKMCYGANLEEIC